jgi:DNA-binding response OmpR family regulator
MEMKSPRCVILDVEPPDGSGFELVDEWRRDGLSAPPMLLVSGRERGECQARAAQSQVPFLHRPYTLVELLETVQTLLGTAE